MFRIKLSTFKLPKIQIFIIKYLSYKKFNFLHENFFLPPLFLLKISKIFEKNFSLFILRWILEQGKVIDIIDFQILFIIMIYYDEKYEKSWNRNIEIKNITAKN